MIQCSYLWVNVQKNVDQDLKEISVLFTTAKIREKPKCPLIDEWVKLWYLHKIHYYSSLKKEGNLCNNINEPGRHYTNWKKPVTGGQMLHDATYMRYLK